MQVTIENPIFQTQLFMLVLLAVLFLTIKKRTDGTAIFPPTVTQELKGLAILTIIFGHIGYFLSTSDQFLFPLSVASGVGVNIFLFLSGYGLTISQLKKPLSILDFYKKRLLRLFIPLWIVLLILYLSFAVFLDIRYPITLMIENFLGIFPEAHIFYSLNSVLWYFTPILFYYLIFPITIQKSLKYFSFLLIYLCSILILLLPLPIKDDVQKLYQLHTLAFPLGVFCATLPQIINKIASLKPIANFLEKLILKRNMFLSLIMTILFGCIFCYFAIYSGVGQGKIIEQGLSLVTTFASVGLFIFKPVKFRFLEIVGDYSYEIYLIHWPLLYHFDLLYKTLPAFLATALYLVVFIGLGYLLQKASNKIVARGRK